MIQCKNCQKEITGGNLLECPSCGATFCSSCGKQTQMICPYCYSDLDYMG